MRKTNRLMNIKMDCEVAISQIRRHLAGRGVRIVRSFDLQSACASYPDHTCPHHGDAPCDCQLVVLLAYGKGSTPASLLVHSHRGQTEVDLVDSPGNRPSRELETTIRLVFETGVESSLLMNEVANVT